MITVGKNSEKVFFFKKFIEIKKKRECVMKLQPRNRNFEFK